MEPHDIKILFDLAKHGYCSSIKYEPFGEMYVLRLEKNNMHVERAISAKELEAIKCTILEIMTNVYYDMYKQIIKLD